MQDLGEAEATVTITVTDVDEPPGPPAAPAVRAVFDDVHTISSNLDVAWSAPDNAGRPAIMNYDVRYRKEDAPDWTDGPQDVTETMLQLESLDGGAVYLVQVRASNDEGDGPYSQPGASSTNSADNDAPTFDLGGVTRTLEESLGDEVDVGGVAVGNPVTATERNTGDTLTYTLGGADASSFTIDETSGQIRTRAGVNYDFESKSSYSLTVTARDDSDALGRTTATVELTDVRPPAAPARPSVSTVSHTSVRVAWTLSAGAVSARVRYMKDGSAQWTEHPGNVSVGFLVVEGLASGSYGVQIQAVGPEGRSAWSQAGFGRTHTAGNSPPAFPNSIVPGGVRESTARYECRRTGDGHGRGG